MAARPYHELAAYVVTLEAQVANLEAALVRATRDPKEYGRGWAAGYAAGKRRADARPGPRRVRGPKA